jgi:hypothetical protein
MNLVYKGSINLIVKFILSIYRKRPMRLHFNSLTLYKLYKRIAFISVYLHIGKLKLDANVNRIF